MGVKGRVGASRCLSVKKCRQDSFLTENDT